MTIFHTNMIQRPFRFACLIAALWLPMTSCNKNMQDTPQPPGPTPIQNDINVWLTKADGSALLEKQTTALGFTTTFNNYPATP